LSCDALGVEGKKTFPIFNPDGFAKIFVTAPATGPPAAEIYGEYIGWGDEDDEQYHIDVVLFE
jgi:hypothetical protein